MCSKRASRRPSRPACTKSRSVRWSLCWTSRGSRRLSPRRGAGRRRSAPGQTRGLTMRITRIRTRQVDVPLPAPFHPAWAPGRIEEKIRLAYVRIDTDAGVYGIAGHEFFGAEEQCVARIAPYMIGGDPLQIEKHAGTLRYLWPYFGTAVWFVEIALWDILGKVAGLPIYKLLG